MACVKLKRIETSIICSIINIKLSTPIFGLPMESGSEIGTIPIYTGYQNFVLHTILSVFYLYPNEILQNMPVYHQHYLI